MVEGGGWWSGGGRVEGGGEGAEEGWGAVARWMREGVAGRGGDGVQPGTQDPGLGEGSPFFAVSTIAMKVETGQVSGGRPY